MKEYIVKIPEAEVETISHVLEKFGVEMSAVTIKEKKTNQVTAKSQRKVKNSKIDHTYLFGKWKDFDIDANKIRKELWRKS